MSCFNLNINERKWRPGNSQYSLKTIFVNIRYEEKCTKLKNKFFTYLTNDNTQGKFNFKQIN